MMIKDNTPIASFPIQLHFNEVSVEEFRAAQKLIEQECLEGNHWKLAKCLFAEPVPGNYDGSFFVLRIEISSPFDWNSEGAYAFSPQNLRDVERNRTPGDQPTRWIGQVIEYDEDKCLLYVDLFDKRVPQKDDCFYICPFDFYRSINRVYNDPVFSSLKSILSERLFASKTGGGVHSRLPSPAPTASVGGLPELYELWRHQWGILWGPPGTGKTYTLGNQVASVLRDVEEHRFENERILIVSTTNRAIDAAAVELGNAALKSRPDFIDGSRFLRVGKGARLVTYEKAGLIQMLEGSDTELMKIRDDLKDKLHKAKSSEEKAKIKLALEQIKVQMKDAWKTDFLDSRKKVICCTAFAALQMLTNDNVVNMLHRGASPFTTVFIDEAGLISRITCAALSLLASRRVVLVGDSKQLSPISKISRLHLPDQATWTVSSGLSHLGEASLEQLPKNVKLLDVQRRMHPDIGEIVSRYMYGHALKHHDGLIDRPFSLCPSPESRRTPRAYWCILNLELREKSYWANRGPGNRSWMREGSTTVMERMFAHPGMRNVEGLYITPFLPQVKLIQDFFVKNDLHEKWSASTVHSQQGQQADVVIFDTVVAGSTGWLPKEWMRLINVAISRAKHLFLLLASKDEMEQPFLLPLLPHLTPCVIDNKINPFPYKRIDIASFPTADVFHPIFPPNSIGGQIEERKRLRPLLSEEQQKLCRSKIDSSPRLVRGVAGSGKTAILAEWLVQCLGKRQEEDSPPGRLPYWVVFANSTLKDLLSRFAKDSWKKKNAESPFPDKKTVAFLHVRDFLNKLRERLGQPKIESGDFEYDHHAAEILKSGRISGIEPLCEALFVDEGQDMGENTLKLLFSVVENKTDKQTMEKPVFVFYDNAQNVYKRSKPRWKDLGINVQGGRAAVMKESFRSTREISEFALNVFYDLEPHEAGMDDMQLVSRGLLKKIVRNKRDWWSVRFNGISGPTPEFYLFSTRTQEFSYLVRELKTLIEREYVSPRDICIIANNKSLTQRHIRQHVAPLFPNLSFEFFPKSVGKIPPNALLVQTPHSIKGFESEVVFVLSADMFVSKSAGILSSPLYVAMTRARSILKVSATQSTLFDSRKIVDSLKHCHETICVTEPDIEFIESSHSAESKVTRARKKSKRAEEMYEIKTDKGIQVISVKILWTLISDKKIPSHTLVRREGGTEWIEARIALGK